MWTSLCMKLSYGEHKLLVFHLSPYAVRSCSFYGMVFALCQIPTLIGFPQEQNGIS